MYEKILIAVDHSEQSDRAVDAGRDLARLSSGATHLLHVKEHDLITGKGGGEYDTEEAGDAEHLLAQTKKRLVDAGIAVTTEIRTVLSGRVADAIVEAARDYDADIILVGSHGRSGIARVLLGGTAYKVVHLAHTPVLVVR